MYVIKIDDTPHTKISVCVFLYVCFYVCKYFFVFVCLNVSVFLYSVFCMFLCLCVCMFVCLYVCIYFVFIYMFDVIRQTSRQAFVSGVGGGWTIVETATASCSSSPVLFVPIIWIIVMKEYPGFNDSCIVAFLNYL